MFGEIKILALGDIHGGALIKNRVDYFLVSSDIEYFVQSSDIGLSYRSDHSPVSIVLQFLNQTQRQGDMQIQ